MGGDHSDFVSVTFTCFMFVQAAKWMCIAITSSRKHAQNNATVPDPSTLLRCLSRATTCRVQVYTLSALPILLQEIPCEIAATSGSPISANRAPDDETFMHFELFGCGRPIPHRQTSGCQCDVCGCRDGHRRSLADGRPVRFRAESGCR